MSVYVMFRNNVSVHKTKPLIAGIVNADYATNGELVGVEVIGGTLERSIDHARERLLTLTDHQRTLVFAAITDGYCRECGSSVLPCYLCMEEVE